MPPVSGSDAGSLDLGLAERWVRAAAPGAGPLELFQVEPWATVFRATTGDDVVWFKACAPRQGFEVALTASLSDRWDLVTKVLSHDVNRRWLLMADAGEPFRVSGNPPARWLELLPRYAELQLGETVHVEDHLAAGVPDLRPARLPALYDEMVRARLPLEPGEVSVLDGFRDGFARWCDELTGIASTVQHDDLHMNNAYSRGAELRVLDWGDASIGHPFFSLFETFRFLIERNGLDPSDPWFGRLRDAYLEPWGSGHRGTFDLALRAGAVARAIAWLHQRDALGPEERAAFDDGFDGILRLAIRSIDGSPFG
jgi:hypothetical protein